MKRILLILESEANRKILTDALSSHYQVLLAEDARGLRQPFDLCISDGPSLRRLEKAIRERRQAEAPYYLPFLLVTTRKDIGLADHMLWRLVDDLIIAPIEKIELRARLESLIRARELALETRRLAQSDALTDLLNRHHFFLFGEQEIERCRRYGRPLSAMMLDLDHFKHINDTYGHLVGDQVLKEIANRIRTSLRKNDLASRYGGDEFALLLPETTPEQALRLAESAPPY